MNWLLGGAIVTWMAAAIGSAGEPFPAAASSQHLNQFSSGTVRSAYIRHLFAGSVVGSVSLVADAAGGGCGTTRIGEITVATLRNAPIVTLLANGSPVTLLLDTGAETTILTPAVAQRIGAQPPRVEFPRQMHGITGSLGTSEVELRSLTAGKVSIPWRRVRVASVNMPSVFSGPLDGLLGADSLSTFDIDLDLPHHRMVFYAKQSCPGAAPVWIEPYARITARRSFSGHLVFPVRLNGREVDAFVDTGAQLTVLSTRAALALGVTETALARDRPTVTSGATAGQLSSHAHRFSSLEIGGEIVRDPEIVVADVKLSDADLVLGIDFLISRRIWLSYGSEQIFLSRRT
jgi:clan AA aspartic protease (TIGR02281 family)